MDSCNDCGRPIDADTRTVHCSNRRLGCYYSGPYICHHCAHWRWREAELRADMLELRDCLWHAGLIRVAGLALMDRALGIQTYKEQADNDGGIRRASDGECE